MSTAASFVSEPFTDLKGFRAAAKAARAAILVAHGHAADAKGIRVAEGCLALDIQLASGFVCFSRGAQVDMTDRVRLGGTFRLRSLV